MPVDFAPDTALEFEKLVDTTYVPVCSPRLLENTGR